MQLPDFFALAPHITLRDPLAAFLGAARGGILDYSYADAVKLAGHSCPTVASAFLSTRTALAALYPGGLPVRGGISVALRGERLDGVNGVIANVVSLLTGVTEDAGFKGIAGRFDRRQLLAFGTDIPGQIRFTRLDDAGFVDVSARLERVPANPRLGLLMPRCLSGTATDDEASEFQSLWQDRVRALLQHADDPTVFVLH
ncbi:MAG: hypothetical protein ABI641_04185 [Caldimonas sp.]